MANVRHRVEEPSPAYTAKLGAWRQTRAACEGKEAINRMQGIVPSPIYNERPATETARSNADEVARRYQEYWTRARYFNATGRTWETLDGMVHSKPAEIELIPKIDYLNSKGVGLRAIAQDIVSNVICVGRHGALVDMPEDMRGASTQAQVSGEKAPGIITFKAEQIIFWREDGDLQEVRLEESYEHMEDEFTFEERVQVRRLVLKGGVYVHELYRDGGLYESYTPVMNGFNMDFIPFQFFGSDNNSAAISSIPLFDLGSQNLGHYALDADNRDNLHWHAQGSSHAFTGMDRASFDELNPQGLDTGAKGLNLWEQGDRFEVQQIEATGALPAEMLRDEARMVQLGAQVVTDTSTQETLGAKRIDANATTSVLKRISINCSDGITQLLEWCAEGMGAKSGNITYMLNTDFVTDSMDPQAVAQHFAAVQAGYLPLSTYFETARKTGFTKKTDEELEQEIGEEAMGMQGTSEEMAALMAENEALKEQLAGGE